MSPLSHLEMIDTQLNDLLLNETVSLDVDEMARLLNERKTCLDEIKAKSDELEKEVWIIAIDRSQHIFNLIKKHRDAAALKTSRFIKGRKSVEIYKKFE